MPASGMILATGTLAGQGVFDQTAARKSLIDAIFFNDMANVCDRQRRWLRPSCISSAAAFYNAVHFGPWGRNAFFG